MRASHTLGWSGLALVIGLHGLLAPPPCLAGPLLQFDFVPGAPVIFSESLDPGDELTYDASTHVLRADLTPNIYTSADVFLGSFSSGRTTLDLKVDNNGDFEANGAGLRVIGALDLDLDGTDDVSGDPTAPLLFGPITAFGADPAGPPTRSFNGLFDIRGGKLTQAITLSGGGTVSGGFPVGRQTGGFLLSAEDVTGGIQGNFAQGFSASSVKGVIGVVTPEPGGLILALVAAATLAGSRRLRRGRP
jgi:hypothetical protein